MRNKKPVDYLVRKSTLVVPCAIPCQILKLKRITTNPTPERKSKKLQHPVLSQGYKIKIKIQLYRLLSQRLLLPSIGFLIFSFSPSYHIDILIFLFCYSINRNNIPNCYLPAFFFSLPSKYKLIATRTIAVISNIWNKVLLYKSHGIIKINDTMKQIIPTISTIRFVCFNISSPHNSMNVLF